MKGLEKLVREAIAEVLSGEGTTTAAPEAADNPQPMAGRYCIARCRDAGVHAGYVQWHNGREAHLTESRRLWRWRVPMGKGSFLSGVALHGIDRSDSKVGEPVEIVLADVCELIPCSDDARKSIVSASVVERVS